MNCTFDASEWNLVSYSSHVLSAYIYMLFYKPMHIWSVSVKNQLEVLSVQAQAQVSAPCQPAKPPSSDSVLSCLHPSSECNQGKCMSAWKLPCNNLSEPLEVKHGLVGCVVARAQQVPVFIHCCYLISRITTFQIQKSEAGTPLCHCSWVL